MPKRAPGTPAEETVVVAVARCAAGHTLECHKSDQAGLSCDGCQKSLGRLSSIWSCATCDYDLCQTCSGTPTTQPGSASASRKRPRAVASTAS